MSNNEDLFKKIIGHCKEYGFVFQSSEIYDGLSAAYDYGPNGVELKNNIKINRQAIHHSMAFYIVSLEWFF